MSVSSIFNFSGDLYKKALGVNAFGVFLFLFIFLVFYVLLIPFIFGLGYEELARWGSTSIESLMYTPSVQIRNALAMVAVNCVTTPLVAGFYKNCEVVSKGESATMGNLFIYYNSTYTVRLLVCALISTVITSVVSLPFQFFDIPLVGSLLSMFVNILLSFAIPIIIFENKELAEAFKESVERVVANFGTILGAFILGGIIGSLGIIACGIGVIFTLPFAYATIYAAYALQKPNGNEKVKFY
ncbi:hypothetical protein [Capnocytophaga bilenii]|jgi:hypothetical protein